MRYIRRSNFHIPRSKIQSDMADWTDGNFLVGKDLGRLSEKCCALSYITQYVAISRKVA